MRKKKVSVIIPSLNEEKNIEALLLSLKNQTYKGDYEIIVSDGNSEDKTREIELRRELVSFYRGFVEKVGDAKALDIGNLETKVSSRRLRRGKWRALSSR